MVGEDWRQVLLILEGKEPAVQGSVPRCQALISLWGQLQAGLLWASDWSLLALLSPLFPPWQQKDAKLEGVEISSVRRGFCGEGFENPEKCP